MNNTEFWDKRRNKITNSVGGWVIGVGAFSRGIDLLGDWAGELSYFQILINNITGKMPSREVANMVEAAFVCLSWPDSRIWCNQIAALGGETRCSPAAALLAGTLASDAAMYGPKTVVPCGNWLVAAMEKVKLGTDIEEIVAGEIKKRSGARFAIPGFGRPVAKGDQKVEVLLNYARKIGFEVGPYEELAFAVEKILSREIDETMNANGFLSSFLMDQGYSPEEIYRFASPAVMAGVGACFVENSERDFGAFLPLRCDDVEYTGKPPRPLPKV